MAMRKVALNDMIGKGWDSAPQESYCWQKFYENGASTDRTTNQFWWVPAVWELHGHAHNWGQHTRDDAGRFLKFPPSGQSTDSSDTDSSDTEASTQGRLLRLATLLDSKRAKDAEALIAIAKTLGNGKIAI